MFKHLGRCSIVALTLLGIVAGCAPKGHRRTTAARVAPKAETSVVYGPALPPNKRLPTGPPPALSLQLAPAPSPQRSVPDGASSRLTILHTNDSRGYVDPCG